MAGERGPKLNKNQQLAVKEIITDMHIVRGQTQAATAEHIREALGLDGFTLQAVSYYTAQLRKQMQTRTAASLEERRQVEELRLETVLREAFAGYFRSLADRSISTTRTDFSGSIDDQIDPDGLPLSFDEAGNIVAKVPTLADAKKLKGKLKITSISRVEQRDGNPAWLDTALGALRELAKLNGLNLQPENGAGAGPNFNLTMVQVNNPQLIQLNAAIAALPPAERSAALNALHAHRQGLLDLIAKVQPQLAEGQ